jgi:hypothetical protein
MTTALLLLALAVQGPLPELEVARAEKPKDGALFKLDPDDGVHELRLSWLGGNEPGVKRPTSFGAMTLQQARAWAMGVAAAAFDNDLSDLSHPRVGPDTVTRGDGTVIPMGWQLDCVQSYKGVAFADPDAWGERAGVRAWVSDDLSFQETGAASASFRVRLWRVVKEHGPAKAVVAKDKAVAAARAKLGKARDVEADAVLFWASKPGAADRRVPLWHVELRRPGAFKPEIESFRIDAWTGTVLEARRVAIPGE